MFERFFSRTVKYQEKQLSIRIDFRRALQECKPRSGSSQNNMGSAFQLEDIREKLITKLEQYLKSRARYDGEEVDEENSCVTKKYTPIDRGFFYNKKLQDAHIQVAAKLLTQLERMQLKNGARIDNPKLFAQVLMEAHDANIRNIKTFARGIDGTGDLLALLNNMRLEMAEVYRNKSNGIDLPEQLGLEPINHSLVRN